jgi:diguanylate cyclase (GGDEF)-like protein
MLIVEDALDQLQTLTGILVELDCRLITASTGEDALDTALQDPPDLILLDIVLPGKDGLDVLRILKEHAQTQEIPVIILTAKGEMEDIVAGLEGGAADYLAKPFHAAELKARVKAHLHSKILQDRHKALIAELQEALGAVRQLSGMIPICAHCKKIRNDSGYWQQVEDYIGGHTEALFTHGLCPDCIPIFFPDAAEAGLVPEPQEPPPEAEKVLQRILVVDDSPMNLKMLIQFLRLDYKILVATNGVVALDLARHERPDLILLDVVMPEMDGRDVCRALKADPRTDQIPIIFVTGNTDEIDEMEGFELGAVDYITKPFSLPLVHARVKTHLELKHYRDVLAIQLMQDALTGLQNRKGFLEYLDIMWKQAIRQHSPMGLVLFNVDHLKDYNLRYGRPAGDECLRKVASALKSMKRRNTDLIARYAGQEFVCLLPGTDGEGTVMVAEMMRQAVESLAIPHYGSDVAPQVTLSAGVASCAPMLGSDPSSLIERASQALFQARREGRNRVHA